MSLVRCPHADHMSGCHNGHPNGKDTSLNNQEPCHGFPRPHPGLSADTFKSTDACESNHDPITLVCTRAQIPACNEPRSRRKGIHTAQRAHAWTVALTRHCVAMPVSARDRCWGATAQERDVRWLNGSWLARETARPQSKIEASFENPLS